MGICILSNTLEASWVGEREKGNGERERGRERRSYVRQKPEEFLALAFKAYEKQEGEAKQNERKTKGKRRKAKGSERKEDSGTPAAGPPRQPGSLNPLSRSFPSLSFAFAFVLLCVAFLLVISFKGKS